MLRRIIEIDEEKCNGCGACANACHEGAIGIIDGKAKLLRDDYCDGFGDCLPNCPMGAISFIEKDTLEYNEEAVKRNKEAKQGVHTCPGSMAHTFNRTTENKVSEQLSSELRQWPCQIKLVNELAPFFDKCDLLIAADCTAYAYANIHSNFMKNKVTLIGCPKLDDEDYSIKLSEIFKVNDIVSITVLRMEVPCCGGLEYMTKKAIEDSGKDIDFRVVTISIDGEILD